MRQMRDREDKAEVICKSKAELNPGTPGLLTMNLDTFTIAWWLDISY